MSVDSNTFNILEALAGISFPEHSVKVHFNEALNFTLSTLNSALDLAVVGGLSDQVTKLQAEIEDLLKSVEGQLFTVHFRGIPEVEREGIIRGVEEIYPTKTNLLGNPEPNPEGDRELRRRMWLAFITKIENPAGAVSVPTEEEIDGLINRTGGSVHETISDGIAELITGTKSGYEQSIKANDFLSVASQED